MNWVKDNLAFVSGLGISLLLMAGAGMYLHGSLEEEKDAQTGLVGRLDRISRLQNQDPHPVGDPERNVDNLALVLQEQERLRERILEPLRQSFTTFEVPDGLDQIEFRNLLEGTLAGMRRKARESGTRLPSPEDASTRDPRLGGYPDYSTSRQPMPRDGESDYAFSFDQERTKLDLHDSLLRPLTFQLLQVEALCQALFDSKVHSIVTIKRPDLEVPEDDHSVSKGGVNYDMYPGVSPGGNTASASPSSSPATGGGMPVAGSGFIEEIARTNRVSGTILYPFQIGFQCHDRELSIFMQELAGNDHFFRIRWMAVDREGFQGFPNHGDRPSQGHLGYQGYPDPTGRAGQGFPPGRRGFPMRAAIPDALEEKLLTVHVLLEVVSRLPDEARAKEDPRMGTYGAPTPYGTSGF